MKDIIRRHVSFVVRNPLTVLLASLLATTAIGLGVLRVAVDIDPAKLLPADDPYVEVDRAIHDQFGGKNLVAIAVVPKSGDVWRPEVLETVHDLTLDLLNSRGIIRQTVVSLSSPYVRVPVERGGVLTAVPLMDPVPTTDEGIARLRSTYEKESLLRNMLVSTDGRAAIVFGDFYDDVKVLEIAATVRALTAKYTSAQIECASTGMPMFYGASAEMMDLQKYYFAATLLAIVVVLALAFGHVQGVVLPCSTALLSTVWAIGFMGLAGISMNTWTAMAPLVVMTVAAGHSAQMLKRYYEELGRLGVHRLAVESSANKIAPVMLAAGGTAGSGFAALSVLGIPSLTQFGLAISSGIFAAVILEMTFMLALRVLWRASAPPASIERPAGRRATAVLEQAVLDHGGGIVFVFAALALAAAAALPRLSTEFRDGIYFPETTQVGHDFRVFEHHFPATAPLMILLEGAPGSMQTPEALRLMTDLQRTMAEDPAVPNTSSLVDLVLRGYQALAEDDEAKVIPDDPRLVAQVVMLSQSPAFERYVERNLARAVVIGFLPGADSAIARRVISRLEGYLAKHPPAGIRVRLAGGRAALAVALNDHAVKGKVLNIVAVLIAILAISSALLRSPVGGALVTAPLAMALLVNLGLFALFGVSFDLIGASIASIGVGIGADYGIYFLYRWAEELEKDGRADKAFAAAMESSGSAILFVALAMSAGFGVYVVSGYYSLRILGIFIPLTMLVSSATALTLLPAVAMLVRPRFLFKHAEISRSPLREVA